MLNRLMALLIALLMIFAVTTQADTVQGRIKYISNKAGSIQIAVKGKAPVLVTFDKNTRFVEANGIKELGPPDLIEVEYSPGQPATRITKVVAGIPKELEIGVEHVDAFLTGDWSCRTPGEMEVGALAVERRGKECMLVDARPAKNYLSGHIPGAINIFAKDLPKKLDLLPKDKSTPVIFYCGGPTCPFTGMSIQTAQKAGYKNLKGFQAGMPAWKKSSRPVHATASWLAKHLDTHHVVIDVRPPAASSRQHINTAVAMPAAEFKTLTAKFIKERKPARLPGVSDKRAAIFLYSDRQDDPDVLAAFKELKKWRYKNVAIIEGGFEGWVKAGLPVASGPAATKITYVRQLVEGAVPAEEFAKLEKHRTGVTFVDVRSDKEVARGMLKGAVHIPLDAIEEKALSLPKDGRIIAYCSNGIRAEMAYEVLKRKGFKNVRFLNQTLKVNKDGSYQFLD